MGMLPSYRHGKLIKRAYISSILHRYIDGLFCASVFPLSGDVHSTVQPLLHSQRFVDFHKSAFNDVGSRRPVFAAAAAARQGDNGLRER